MLPDEKPAVGVGICVYQISDTVSAIIPLVRLGNSDHVLLSFTFDLHDSHETERMKDAIVEAATLLDWNDASLARNVEDQ